MSSGYDDSARSPVIEIIMGLVCTTGRKVNYKQSRIILTNKDIQKFLKILNVPKSHLFQFEIVMQ